MTDTSIQAGGQSIRKLGGLFKVMRVAIIFYVLVETVLIVQTAITLDFVGKIQSGAFTSDAELTARANLIDASGLLIGIAYLLVFIASVIMVSRFTYRAMKNLHLASAAGVSMSPGWAVGWYFIPIAMLWKPLQGMLQIWRGSLDPQAASAPVSAMIGWWWACWLLTNILANASFRLSGGFGMTDSLEMLQISLWLDVIGSSVGIAAALLLIRITRKITEAQSSLMHGGIADTFN